MQSNELLELAVSALENLKGIDIRTLDVRGLTDITDYMVIASGRSDRHVRALAEELVLAAKRERQAPLGIEGEREGEWVLVDLCDVVVHIQQPEVRDLYQLEKLWAHSRGETESAIAVLDPEAQTGA